MHAILLSLLVIRAPRVIDGRGHLLRNAAVVVDGGKIVAVDEHPTGADIDLPGATLSFHLAHLARTGLVQSRQEGRFVIYSADFQAMNALVGYLTENCCGGRACAPANPRKGKDHETLSRTRRRA